MANSASQGQHHCVVVMKQENLGMAYSCDWDYRGFLVLIKLLMALSCCKGVGGSFFFLLHAICFLLVYVLINFSGLGSLYSLWVLVVSDP